MPKIIQPTVVQQQYLSYFSRAPYRYVFEHRSEKNADGTPVRCRVNGKCKLWKTWPAEFRLPVKHGLYTCFYITQENANEWYPNLLTNERS